MALMLRNDFAFFEATWRRSDSAPMPCRSTGISRRRRSAYILRDCGAKVLVIHADLLAQIAAGDSRQASRCLVVPTPPEIGDAYGIAGEAAAPPAGSDALGGMARRRSALAERRRRGARQHDLHLRHDRPAQGRAPARRRRRERRHGRGDARAASGLSAAGRAMRTVIMRPDVSLARPMSTAAAQRASAASSILQPRFDAEELLRLIERDRITPPAHGADHVRAAAEAAGRR